MVPAAASPVLLLLLHFTSCPPRSSSWLTRAWRWTWAPSWWAARCWRVAPPAASTPASHSRSTPWPASPPSTGCGGAGAVVGGGGLPCLSCPAALLSPGSTGTAALTCIAFCTLRSALRRSPSMCSAAASWTSTASCLLPPGPAWPRCGRRHSAAPWVAQRPPLCYRQLQCTQTHQVGARQITPPLHPHTCRLPLLAHPRSACKTLWAAGRRGSRSLSQQPSGKTRRCVLRLRVSPAQLT